MIIGGYKFALYCHRMRMMGYWWIDLGGASLVRSIGAGQKFGHKTDIGYGQAKSLDAWQSFLVRECWYLR